MKVLVCGGRHYHFREGLYATLDHVLQQSADTDPFDVLIAGGARGADQLAFEWALERGVFFVIFPADWDLYGRRAGPVRNQRMRDEGQPDAGIAFPGGTGTEHMFYLLETAGIAVWRL